MEEEFVGDEARLEGDARCILRRGVRLPPLPPRRANRAGPDEVLKTDGGRTASV